MTMIKCAALAVISAGIVIALAPMAWSDDSTYTWATADSGGDGEEDRIDDSAALKLVEITDDDGLRTLVLEADVNETVAELWLDGVEQAGGTWGSTSSSADNQDDDYFSGSGILRVVGTPKALLLILR
jgi:hypothetical protein